VPSTIEIRTDVRSGSGVIADASEIHRVVMNLSTNAVLAMNGQGGVLDIGLADVDVDDAYAARLGGVRPGKFVRLRLRDSGCGIDPRILEHIFDPFFTTRTKGTGTGMGLAVVHGIITSLHGAILVESAPGAGTTFDIFVPVAETSTSAPPASARAILTGTERVLVVDDDRLVLDSVVAMLSQLGYQVQAQTNAAAALAAFESDPQAFDLVLTDMTMPGMTGDVLAERLKRCRPDIPVILTSGFNDERNQGDAMVQAVDGYLAKPIFLETLSEVVRGTLRNAVADRRGPAIGYARA